MRRAEALNLGGRSVPRPDLCVISDGRRRKCTFHRMLTRLLMSQTGGRAAVSKDFPSPRQEARFGLGGVIPGGRRTRLQRHCVEVEGLIVPLIWIVARPDYAGQTHD